MSRPTTKYYATPDEAIASAKKRAKSTYSTQYIYQGQDGLYVRNTLVEAEGPVAKVLFDGTINQLKPFNEELNKQIINKQIIKDTVELIVSLESQADELTEQGNFSQSSAATEAVQMLEKELEEQGYFLGESGSDIVVYHADRLKVIKDEWMRFDRLEWKWRQPV